MTLREYIKVYFKSEGWLSLFILFDIIKLKIYKKIMFAWNYLNVIKKKAEREWKHVLMFRLKYQTLNNNSKMNIESNGKIANNKQYNNKILQFKMKSVKHFFWWWWNSFTPALLFVISPHPIFIISKLLFQWWDFTNFTFFYFFRYRSKWVYT